MRRMLRCAAAQRGQAGSGAGRCHGGNDFFLIHSCGMALFARTDFNWEWKAEEAPEIARLARERVGRVVLDVGCGSVQLYRYLSATGWTGRYIGIDKEARPALSVLPIEYIPGDVLEVAFPEVDTCLLYNILEHVRAPDKLLAKSLSKSRNALLAVPRRNEALWAAVGLSEYHQLDHSHLHNGFVEEELRDLVRTAGGAIRELRLLDPVRWAELGTFFRAPLARWLYVRLAHRGRPDPLYQTFWAEVVPR